MISKKSSLSGVISFLINSITIIIFDYPILHASLSLNSIDKSRSLKEFQFVYFDSDGDGIPDDDFHYDQTERKKSAFTKWFHRIFDSISLIIAAIIVLLFIVGYIFSLFSD